MSSIVFRAGPAIGRKGMMRTGSTFEGMLSILEKSEQVIADYISLVNRA